MAEKLEFLLPKFAHEGWGRVGVPESSGEVKVFGQDDLAFRERALLDVAVGQAHVLAREAKPTMWAQAETFRQLLSRRLELEGAIASPEFQIWAGLLAAAFQGDLEVRKVGPAELSDLDEDLNPALGHAALPLTPDVKWPSSLLRLHQDYGIWLLTTGDDGSVVGGCYATCLVFPALEMPSRRQDPRLEKFSNDKLQIDPDFSLDFLMKRYNAQAGFTAGFAHAVREMVARVSEDDTGEFLFSDLTKALQLLERHLTQFYGVAASASTCEADHPGLLHHRYLKQIGDTPGRVEYWKHYPLQGRTGTKKVLFIPVNIDRGLNKWAEDPAFPGSDDPHTRLCDLRIEEGSDGDLPRVIGRDGQIYEVPAEYELVTLDPKPARRSPRQLILDSMFYLEGEGNAIDDALVDKLHRGWRTQLGNRKDLTPILPLTTRMFELFPRLLDDPSKFVRLDAGAIGSPTAKCRLDLPLEAASGDVDKYRQFVWEPTLTSWSLPETRLPSVDVWPAFKGDRRGAHGFTWSTYFVRTRVQTEKLALFVHGSEGIRKERPAPSTQTVRIDRLKSPPRVGEVLLGEQAEPLPMGLVFLSPEIYEPIAPSGSTWKACIDLGTSNTSVAIQETGKRPRLLPYRAWAAPLIRSQARKEVPIGPGWFPQSNERKPIHTGFFPTLLGFRNEVLGQAELLKHLENPSNMTGEDLAQLIGDFDLLSLKGKAALVYRDASINWGVVDGLKWAQKDTEDPTLDLRRRAFRTVFLELLMLTVNAEAYAATGQLPTEFTFTYPLSMKKTEINQFYESAVKSAGVVQKLIDPEATAEVPRYKLVNESQAIFRAYLASKGHDDKALSLIQGKRVVIIDMGGGSADYAVFAGAPGADRGNVLCFLDSLKLAGNRFFEFLSHTRTPAEKKVLSQTLTLLFGTSHVEDKVEEALREMQSDPELPEFRQLYNVNVSSNMPHKGIGQITVADHEATRRGEAAFAEELALQLEHYAPGHWMRSLFKTVICHGLLLGLAPRPGEAPPRYLELVLAGNGWGLLHHAGVRRQGDAAKEGLVLPVLKDLASFFAHKQRHQAEPPSTLPAPEDISIMFMDADLGDHAFYGEGVYSKDAVALGGLQEEKDDDQGGPQGILGYDLEVHPAVRGEGGRFKLLAKLELPWYQSVGLKAVNRRIEKEVAAAAASEAQAHPFGGGQVVAKLVPAEDALTGREGADYALDEQLLALSLLRTSGSSVEARKLLKSEEWAGWNEFVQAEIRDALEVYGRASTEKQFKSTSAIRHVWEYVLVRRSLQDKLFERMTGRS